MTFSTSQVLMASETPEEYFDRRRHKRVDIQLPGRFLTHIGDDASLSVVAPIALSG